MLNKLLSTNGHVLLCGGVIAGLLVLVGLGDVSPTVAVPVVVAAAGIGVAAQGATTTKVP